jgi:hypothetical protein
MTMGEGRIERLAAWAGVLFFAVFLVGFLISGDTPDSDSTGEAVIDHYDDSGKILAGALLLMAAGVLLLFFFGVLRRHLAAGGPEWLATVVFGGAVVFVAGLGDFMSSQIALLEASDEGQVGAAEVLNVIDNNNFGPCAIGLAVMFLGSAWHALTSRSLPSWLGWTALLLGLCSIAGPLGFIAFLLFPLWVLGAAITLMRGADSAPGPAPAAAV